MPDMTVAEYAKARGVTRQAIELAIHKGRLKASVVATSPRVMIDPYKADREWVATTRARVSTAPPSESQAAGEESTAVNYNFERARKAKIDADLAELNLQRARGEVVNVHEARALWFRHWRTFRDRLLAVAEREAGALSACTAPHEARAIVDRAIRLALDDLPQSPPEGEAAA